MPHANNVEDVDAFLNEVGKPKAALLAPLEQLDLERLFAMKKVLFFTQNRSIFDVYKKMFPDEPYLWEHIERKMNDGEYKNLLDMFFQLDDANQIKFLLYALKEYNGIKNL